MQNEIELQEYIDNDKSASNQYRLLRFVANAGISDLEFTDRAL